MNKQGRDIERSVERLLRQLGSDNSRRVYRNDWGRFLTWLNGEGLTVTEVKPRHVEDHIIWLHENQGCTRSTCSRALSVIRAIYGILARDEIIATNPAREVKNPKYDSTPKVPVLAEEQVKRLLNLPAETWKERRNKLVVEILLGLGWRRSEVARMRLEDFSEDGSLSKKKGGKTAATGVPKFIVEKIREWCHYAGIKEGPIFIRSIEDRREISGEIVYKIVKGALTQAGIEEGSPHALRRSFATLLYKSGKASLRELQIALSHSSSVTTERYTKVVDAHKIAPGEGLEDLFTKETP